MFRYIDIHTHHLNPRNHYAIVNLNINNVSEQFDLNNHKNFSIGIHPWDVHVFDKNMLQSFENFAANPKIIAIGECGLDKNSEANFEEQKELFVKHILISEKLQKPLIIHCVGFFNELVLLKRKFKPFQAWIIHGFRGKPALAKQLISNNFYISFGEKHNVQSVKICPVEKICIESDESPVSTQEIYSILATLKTCNSHNFIASNQLFNFNEC